MTKVAVVTVGRSDYGIYRPILKRIVNSSNLDLSLIVGGTHLSKKHGYTVKLIEADGFVIGEEVPVTLDDDRPSSVAHAMGESVVGFAGSFSRISPDILLVLGDRFEMLAAAVAAAPYRIPVGHIHGGEVTEGALDDAFRHSITKLSHAHFVSTQTYAQRVIQLGEDPGRVHVVGAPSLDQFRNFEPFSRDEFHPRFGVDLPSHFALVTYHPTTLSTDSAALEFSSVIEALSRTKHSVLFTMPNEDVGGNAIREMIRNQVESRDDWQAVEALGTEGYFSAMSYADVMVGNSSSGIIEAKMFELPVVNVGARQLGRVRGGNVIDVANDACEIEAAIYKAVSPQFKEGFADTLNPYGDGHASERIIKILEETRFDKEFVKKHFHDLVSQ